MKIAMMHEPGKDGKQPCRVRRVWRKKMPELSPLWRQPLEKQPEFLRLEQAYRAGRTPLMIYGLSEGQKAHVLCALEQERALVLVTHTLPQAHMLAADVAALSGRRTGVLPPREQQLFRAAAASRELSAQRIRTLYGWATGEIDVLVAPVDALLQSVMPREEFAGHTLKITTGARQAQEELSAVLVAAGYHREEMVEAPGQFALRGGIVDIFPMQEEWPSRIEFFDDEVDSIRTFDPDTQRSREKREALSVLPALEVIPGDAAWERAKTQLASAVREGKRRQKRRFDQLEKERARDAFPEMEGDEAAPDQETAQDNSYIDAALRLEQLAKAMTEAVTAREPFQGMEHYLGLFYEQPASLLAWRENVAVALDEPARIRERAQDVALTFSEMLTMQLEQGQALPAIAKGQRSYEQLLGEIALCPVMAFQGLVRAVPELHARETFQFLVRSVPAFPGRIELLAEEIRAWHAQQYAVLLLAGEKARGKHLQSALLDQGVEAVYAEGLERPLQSGEIVILPLGLSHGFEYPQAKFAVIATGEVLSAPRQQKSTLRSRHAGKGQKIGSLFTDLKVGDYVVHELHGVGLYHGIQRITVEGKSRDYLDLSFAGGDKLFVPTDQMDRVQKYIGVDEGAAPKLSRIGGSEWKRTKKKVSQSVALLAEDLVALYAQRAQTPGYAFSPDTPWQREFEDNFPYQETADQLACIEEIKRDMESPRPMDRLLCGDVGYGKTEVAVRAAFKAVADSKQVAFLVPTTILAQQHYNTLVQRLGDLPVRCEVLSRFKTAAEQKDILRRLASGQVDIIVGTHRLLGKDVRFKDLGLLIVDEEQRFGVAHKEKIKKLKKNIDVLTLSATPIPRTLHMSMIGIRDLSVLENPPEERYPVQTYVIEYNEALVREAVNRELSRGGQVYMVYNRVAGIDRFAARLRGLMPGVRIGVAHGQMPEGALEDAMMAFMNHEIDLLLCTTIIENGLDIPTTNTIIVCDSERLGLSQLYQLRGRVGRSNRLAYAYFTYRPDRIMSEVAEKRLRAIREFTEFGSGFKVAMRDLEIRGAGNLVGAQQHGHMAAVGYEMYVKLIEEAVQALGGGPKEEKRPETQVEARVDAFIPSNYIRGEAGRIAMYQRIAAIASREEMDDVIDEIIDRYGDPPEPVMGLLAVALARTLATKMGAQKLSVKPGFATLLFYEDAKLDPQALFEVLGRYKGRAKLSAAVPPSLQLRGKDATAEALLEEMTRLMEEVLNCKTGKDSV